MGYGKKDIQALIGSCYPILYVVSQESEDIVVNFIKQQILELKKFKCFEWSMTTGLLESGVIPDKNNQTADSTKNALPAITAFMDIDKPAIAIMKHLHAEFRNGGNPVVIRKLQDFVNEYLNKKKEYKKQEIVLTKIMIIVSPVLLVPDELLRLITVVDFELQKSSEIKPVITELINDEEDIVVIKNKTDEEINEIASASVGLSNLEIKNGLYYSYFTKQDFDPKLLNDMKSQIVRKNMMIEPIDNIESIDNLGGFDRMKEWLIKRKAGFSVEGRKFGLSQPRGVLMVGLQGSGKCVQKDTLIFTKDGMVPISKYAGSTKEKEFYKLKLDVFSKDGVKKTKHFYNNGIAQTIKIKTKRGYEIEGTPNHPVLVMNRDCNIVFKKLSDLKESDNVCIQRNQNYWGKDVDLNGFVFKRKIHDNHKKEYCFPNKMNKNLARLLGYMVAEGCMVPTREYQFGISNASIMVKNDLITLFKNIFNKEVFFNGIECVVSAVQIKKFFIFCGMMEVLSKDKEIPWSILQSSKKVVAEYLRAYFEGEGSVNVGGIEISTASEKMSQQLQVVLLNFGIVCNRSMSMKSATNGKNIKRPYYRLFISGNNIDIFFKEIGFISKEKNDKLNNIVGIKRNTNINTIPYIKEKIRGLYNIVKLTNRPVKSKDRGKGALGILGEKLSFKMLGHWIHQVSYERLNYILDNLKPKLDELPVEFKNVYKKLEHIYKYNFFYDSIKEITIGKSQTYDFEVSGDHCFFSNGFISHNTMCSRVIASIFNLPLYKLDLSKLFGSFIGQSEQRTRDVLKTLEAVSPCVVLFDEIEKGLAGLESSGKSDSGTSARVIGTVLQWLNDKQEPVFVCATANRISTIPPELLRCGRLDRVFFVPLPSIKEREKIYEIHIRKSGRDPNIFDLVKLSEESVNLSGAEIEQSIKEALYEAFNKKLKDIDTQIVLESTKKIVPLYETAKEQLQEIYQWVGFDPKTNDGIRAHFVSEYNEDKFEIDRKKIGFRNA